ncbi:MAG: hypothetical protein EPN93_06900 [Spirochaetes bacterium]|nr:MAG: hypothetical protein EPN93_06900 [Spirochaetota bacterium]
MHLKTAVIICMLLCLPLSYEAPAAESITDLKNAAVVLNISRRNSAPYTEVNAVLHSLDILGIQHIETEDVATATKYPLIVIAGDIRNTTFTRSEQEEIFRYVESGGTLLAPVVTGNKYFSLFGIKQPADSNKRFAIEFKESSTDDSLKYLDRKEERSISLGNKKLYSETIWTHSCELKDAKSLGTTEDGLSVFSVNQYGEGLAYMLGVSFTGVVLQPHVGNDYEAQRTWINRFEPGSDVFLMILKAVYEKAISPYVYLSTIPYGYKTALILSHDVDAQLSFRNSIDYAELEKRFGVRSTFFVTTKYFKDEMDIGYYETERISYMRKVKELGGDVQSHTVTHSINFDLFPVGAQNTTKAVYNPLEAPTVFGELLVSKELLDRDIPGQNTISFRAGDLRYPERLIEVMEKSGYKYDSTFSANDIMCNFAYRALKQRRAGADNSSIVEIPVTFDDSQGYVNLENYKDMVKLWIDVIWANADNEAISVLLLHTSETAYKLKSEELLLQALQGKDIWIGDLTTYGDFWNERSNVRYNVAMQNGTLFIRMQSAEIPDRVSFVIGKSPEIKSIELLDSKNRKIKFKESERGNKIFLRIII